jgi:serine/threonine protein phosphatase PrpC
LPAARLLDIGAATRPQKLMDDNGDAFVIKSWGVKSLVGVIDGLGHGELAHRAAEVARVYVENHCDLPLMDIFRGTNRTCRGTRGVVMALARFDAEQGTWEFASVGNIEARLCAGTAHRDFVVRRGVIGVNAPDPVVTEQRWAPGCLFVLHSDGLKTHWHCEDFAHLKKQPAARIAQELLRKLAKEEDDATVVVVKETVATRAVSQ